MSAQQIGVGTGTSTTGPFYGSYTLPVNKCELGCDPMHHCLLRHAAKAQPDVQSWSIYCSCPYCSPRC